MYITHNRVYQGARARARDGGESEVGRMRVASPRIADAATPYVYIGPVSAKSAPSATVLARNKHKSSEAYLAAPRRTLK